jgi:hypothetical protein
VPSVGPAVTALWRGEGELLAVAAHLPFNIVGLQQFDQCLADAQRLVDLIPDDVVGYIRKGRCVLFHVCHRFSDCACSALFSMKQLPDAFEAFKAGVAAAGKLKAGSGSAEAKSEHKGASKQAGGSSAELDRELEYLRRGVLQCQQRLSHELRKVNPRDRYFVSLMSEPGKPLVCAPRCVWMAAFSFHTLLLLHRR